MNRFAIATILLLSACKSDSGWHLKPVIPAGPPLRVADRLYLLTTQHHLRYGTKDDPDIERLLESKIYTDLWTFDADTAAPLSRQRLRAEKPDSTSPSAILRAEAGSLWIKLPEGAVAIPITPTPNAITPAYYTQNSTYLFRHRGLKMPTRWLGLLDDSEASLLRDKNQMYPNLERPAPRKLWGARVNNGTHTALSPLTAEFQNPGLLGINSQPLLLHNPDSVLIHHQDRQLTRIAGPAGNAVWTAQLPFTIIQSVLPGGQSLAFLGAQPGPENTTQHFVTAIQLATGALQSYNLSLLDGNPPPKNP